MGWQHLQGGTSPQVKGEKNIQAAKKGHRSKKGRGRTEVSYEAGTGMQVQDQAVMLSLFPRSRGDQAMARLKLAAAPGGFPHVSGCSFLLPTISSLSLANSMPSRRCVSTDCSPQPQPHHPNLSL